MPKVYIFAGVMIVIAAAATYFLFLGKVAQKMFKSKEKKTEDE